MKIRHFFDPNTWTVTYVVHSGRTAIVIDPVRDYDPKSARTAWTSCDAVAAYIVHEGLGVAYAVDTHVHADHLTGIPYFRERFGARSVIGRRVGEIQETFREIFNLGSEFPVDGRPFDVLLDDGDRLAFGELELEALHTPGHTRDHMSWRVGDAIFLGDTLFPPDYGTARCDFPGGSAGELFDSIQRIYSLPDATRLFVCHDYLPGGRPLTCVNTVAEQKRASVQLDAYTTRESFVRFRNERDRGLAAPVLILPSVQVNIRAGELPPPESNGVRYLKIPLDYLGRGG